MKLILQIVILAKAFAAALGAPSTRSASFKKTRACFQNENTGVEPASGLWFLASRQKRWGVHRARNSRMQASSRAGAIRRDAGLNRPEAGATILKTRPSIEPSGCSALRGLSAILLCFNLLADAEETNSITPVTARDFFNAGTKLLATKKFADAEKMFSSSLAAQDETLQARTEFNLGHTRFADGAEILKQGPDAQKVSAQGEAALAAGENALRHGETSQAENQLDKMVSAYLAGRGARRELRAAEKIVKAAMRIYGKTLAKWQRADDDFKGAAELNPADTNATHNAAVVEKEIAKLVDTLRKMQQMAGKMAGQKDQLGKMLSKLKGKIPAPDAPPGGKGEDDDEEKDDGSGKGDVKPESLKGKEENAGRDGEQLSAPLSPDQAGQMLDGLPVDSRRRLPMGGDKQGTPPKDKNGRNW